jgi:two-component system nitrate/nitrite response regulator NarL
MRYGARGFLSKHASGEAYVSAIRSVVAGAAFVGPAPLADRRSDRSNARALSEREQLALAFIAGGFTHQQTARRMGVSKATVDTYVGRIRTKLRVGNKAELALAALRHVDPMYRQTVSQCR